MAQRKTGTVIPLHDDKFYVYALFKPSSFNPFYIGKGIRSRINDHFKASNLQINTPKTGIIKKYGNLIKREILCYFDTEEAAYAFEEYLIELYGLEEDGGYLVNYAKSRFEYSDKFARDIAVKGYLSRKRKYSKEKIIDALNRCYVLKQPTNIISTLTNIPLNYLGYVLRGEKCKADYMSFMQKHPDIAINSKQILSSAITATRSISHSHDFDNDTKFRELFEVVCNGEITLKEAASCLVVTEKYLSDVYCGKSRLYLNLDYNKYLLRYIRGKAIKSINTTVQIRSLISEGLSHKDIIDKLKIGRTTFYRLLKKMNLDNNA